MAFYIGVDEPTDPWEKTFKIGIVTSVLRMNSDGYVTMVDKNNKVILHCPIEELTCERAPMFDTIKYRKYLTLYR